MREVAERKEAKAERKRAALAAIRASLLVGGWLCPGCNEWNLSFRNLCYRCNGKRTAAGVLSRGVPDPRRDEQDRDESDSDDSAAIDLRRSRRTILRRRSSRSSAPPGPCMRGSGSKKRSNPPGGAQGGGSKGKFPKGRGTRSGAAAWLGRCGCAHLPRHRPGARPRSPPPCRRGPSGARHPSGLRPQGATAPAEWLSRSWQQRPIPGR